MPPTPHKLERPLERMKKEARYNTIFIVLLLAISLPGIVMLVRKKLNQPPRPSRGALAAPVRTDVVYVDPLPQGPRLTQFVPPLTRQWVAGQSPLVARQPSDNVINSTARSFELIGIDRAGGRVTLTLLLWDPRLPREAQGLGFALVGPAGTREGAIQSLDTVLVPEPVLEELRNSGYLTPPAQITRVAVAFDNVGVEGELRLKARSSVGPFEDRLDLARAAPWADP